MAGRVPDEDATVAARLAAAGAVLLGKLALTEGAFSEHRPERPEPRNPWSPAHWTGVSSSGSGVAVAAGLAFAALATDTGGSIRFPSSACGVTGLKPSYGRVSRHGVFPLAASLDHVGPMARSAADCAVMLEAIAGPDPRDPTSLVAPPALVSDADVRDLRIGVDLEILASVHPAVAGVVGKAVAALSGLGCEIVEVTLPALEPLARGWAVTCGVEAAIAHADLFDKAPDDYGPALRALIELGRSVPARAYAELHLARLAFAGAMVRLHEEVDLIALPALPMPTPTLALLAQAGNDSEIVGGMLRFTAAFDYSGQPSLTLPGGVDEDGLPIGFQLIGPVLGEAAAASRRHRLPAGDRLAPPPAFGSTGSEGGAGAGERMIRNIPVMTGLVAASRRRGSSPRLCPTGAAPCRRGHTLSADLGRGGSEHRRCARDGEWPRFPGVADRGDRPRRAAHGQPRRAHHPAAGEPLGRLHARHPGP